MPKFQIQADVEHAILFLSDAIPNFEIPQDIGSSFAVATKNCIVFKVMHCSDGTTSVTITDRDCDREDGGKLWSGWLELRSGALILSDSFAFAHISVPTSVGHVDVDIWADDRDHPEWVWIKLSSIG